MAQTAPRKITSSTGVLQLYALSWFIYLVVYLGRFNLSVSMSEIMRWQGATKSQLGLVAACFFISYGAGQLVSGFLGDRLPPVGFVFLGILVTGAANLLFAVSSGVPAMELFWALNGLGQSFIWSPMLRLFSDRLQGSQCVRICLILSTTGPAGMFCMYGLSALLIKYADWRACFAVPGGAIIVAALLWLWMVPRILRQADTATGEAILPEAEAPHPSPVAAWPVGRLFTASGLLYIGLACFLQGALREGVVTWMPSFLTETFSISASYSATLSMVMPLVNLAGVVLAQRLTKHLTHNDLDTAAILFAAAAGAILLLQPAAARLGLTVVLMSVVTTFLSGVGVIFISLMPLYFQRTGRVSTVCGLLSCFGFAGSALSSYGFGNLADRYGWGPTRLIWLAIALAALIMCLLGHRPWRRFSAG